MLIPKEVEAALAAETVRDDFIPASGYISPAFQQLEYERMWNKVWQVACREEEIPKVGDYVTYEIGNQSFIIVRTAPDRIKSYYNVCLHRGRRLTASCGHAAKFHCNYHGWQWNLDGSIARVLDREDWHGCSSMSDDDLHLRETRCETWEGFVFINMDMNAEPLIQYLGAAAEALTPYEYGKMRLRFYATFRLPCNWKVAPEAFEEGYHVAATHPQVLEFIGDDYTRSYAHGKHGMFLYPYERAPFGQPSPRLNKSPRDLREGIIGHFDQLTRQLPVVLYTQRDAAAARRLMTEASADESFASVMGKTLQFQKEAALAEGAGWPDLTPEQMAKAGADWLVFPNLVTLPYPDGVIVYRSRPDGDDPDSCIYDVWGLQRYSPGAEPAITRHQFMGKEDWRGVGEVSIILDQDFKNMEQVQIGMKSFGFPGNRPNPIQELAIVNKHRVLREEYLFRNDRIDAVNLT